LTCDAKVDETEPEPNRKPALASAETSSDAPNSNSEDDEVRYEIETLTSMIDSVNW
jgi:hypothetical protein